MPWAVHVLRGEGRPHGLISLLAKPDGFHRFTNHKAEEGYSEFAGELEPQLAIEDGLLAWCRGLCGEVEIKGRTCGLSAGTWCFRLLPMRVKKSAACLLGQVV
jgi:hypothetical protein